MSKMKVSVVLVIALLASVLLASVALAAHAEIRFPAPVAAAGSMGGLAANLGTTVFVNEIHYDNDGADADEGVEVAGPAGTDLTGWTIVGYNGNGGALYSSTNLGGIIADQQAGYGTLFFAIVGLQNGAPDGLALVNGGGTVVQFLSYEGSFSAVGGPADGMVSVDIGVSEASTSPVGHSLQLAGTGLQYEDFVWSGSAPHTRGLVNTGQSFAAPSADLSITKSAEPDSGVAYHGAVTYTVVLQNSAGVSDTLVLVTDTLPISTTFARWVPGGQPARANVAQDELTWAGSVDAGEHITFTFLVSHTGDYGEVITNTVEYSGTSGTGSAEAAFAVESLFGDVTFVYHDLEDVVQVGETVYLAGDFNGWTPLVMTADAGWEVFSVVVPGLAIGETQYKYIVNDGSDHSEWLNSSNHSYTVVGDATVDDYRAVVVGWANLQWPPTLTVEIPAASDNVYGQAWVDNVTNAAGEGRRIKAEVGYGDNADLDGWTWFPMGYNADSGNNDEFMGVMTPTVAGTFSYTTRFDGNWGPGNPNAGWAYGDLDGVGAGEAPELAKTGVITVTGGGEVPPVILLLTEFVVTPTAGEFIEIYNPTGMPVDLSDVYLTDATYAGDGSYYYKIVTGSGAGGGTFGDFHARFPHGATIDPGEYQTVALNGSANFIATYAVTPTYELYEDGAAPDAIPDMREAVTNSINKQGGLSNGDEVIILYYWDGQTDLVTDLDYAVWGAKLYAVDKTGVSIDGPDADAVTSAYLPDTAISSQDVVGTGGQPHASGKSSQRKDVTEGVETKAGGNGSAGHDETSEDLHNTWSEYDPTPNAGVTMLLLTEFAVTPTPGEFIEIYNPTGMPIDLSDVYLTDATYAPNGTYYYNIVTGSNAGGGNNADFHARFPDGAMIDPGEYQTIALNGSPNFIATYSVTPTYELYEDGAAPDAIPDMREALPGSINKQGGLSNGDEVVILYTWDGQSDLVTDLDYAVWGAKLYAVDKTGVSIDGPDADVITSTYLADTAIGSQDVVGGGQPHASGKSTQRVDVMEGTETKAGGNGATGHDETSEDLHNTWGEYDPTSNAGLTMLLLTEFAVTPTPGEFIEIYNPTGMPIDLSDVYLTDATYAGSGTYYYKIVTGSGAGGGNNGDFHARFPDGATIDPGEYQTIALNGSPNFIATYAVAPTYELYEDDVAPDAIPDMREAFTDSIKKQGGLSNGDEVIVLYCWDGETDLVTDLDYAVWGAKLYAVDKTGVSIDGPDAGVITSTYLADTAIGSQDIVGTNTNPLHPVGKTVQRKDFTEGVEAKTGGNGANGHNETSENLSVTWREDDPTPGTGGAGPTEAPVIVATTPVSNTTGVDPYLPIKATFDMAMDDATIDETTFTLDAESGPIAGLVYYDSGLLTAVFDPNGPLAVGTVHTATVKAAVASDGGTPMGADYTWVFTTAASATLHPYLGSLHNHTSYSDGTSNPDAAFSSGQARGLDFMAITDHSHSTNDAEWADTLAQASSHTVDGTFVAIRGAEFTQGSEGHINVYNTVRHPVRSDTTATCTLCDYTPTLYSFYNWLALHPEATGMFNHPGWMNFNDWEYRADVEPMMQLLEVGNGAYSYYVWTEEEYRKALDYGWRTGPTNSGDTHSDEWAIDNPGRTGIWASALTLDGVLEAMDSMRVYATEDGNLVLFLKADGAWMGETIPNDGTIDFEIFAADPDGEALVSLELYTDQGRVVTSTVPPALPYTWTFSLDISEGVHYYFARAEQADGDRTVSAPIWTEGEVDVAPTELEITPAQLSTLSPASLSARVTNRGIADAVNVTVTFKVDAAVIGTKVITVPAGGDAFAAVGWMPDVTGMVDIIAELAGVPAGDNPDDNLISEPRNIVDYEVPLIVIDNGQNNNVFVSGDGSDFESDLVAHGFNWIEDTDGLTAGDLASAMLLVISDPGSRDEDVFTAAEEQAIADYVNAGGALLIAGDSDYSNNGNPEEINAVLENITGARIRMNSDGTYDDTNNGGVGPWHVLWHNFPATDTLGIGVNVLIDVGFSGCSIYGVDESSTPVALTTGGGVTLTVVGDDDTYQFDGDNRADHFVYPAGLPIPMAAVQALPGGGRIAVWGDSSEAFSDSYTYVPGDGYQNEIYNMQTIYWLIGRQFEKWTVAQARADVGLDDSPDHLNELVWVEGAVTAEYGNFYDVLYVQDDTGGVTVYAPVTALAGTLALGTQVRVVGRVETYQGDTELQIDWDPEQVQIIGQGTAPDPLALGTGDVALESNEGWLVQTFGRVVAVPNNYQFVVDDGTGPARVFIDGYNGSFAGIQVGDWVQVVGLASEDGDGQRIRVRTATDVVFTPPTLIYLPLVMR